MTEQEMITIQIPKPDLERMINEPPFISDAISVGAQVIEERRRQDKKWGEQNHPNGTGNSYKGARYRAQVRCETAFKAGEGTWLHVLDEEVQEAFAEEDPARLREELIQVAAVAIAWVEAIDRAGS